MYGVVLVVGLVCVCVDGFAMGLVAGFIDFGRLGFVLRLVLMMKVTIR